MTWRNRLKQRKSFKEDISKELIAILWHGILQDSAIRACQKMSKRK